MLALAHRVVSPFLQHNAPVKLLSLLIAVLALAVSPAGAEEAPLLVDAGWVQARLAEPKVRVIDMVTAPNDYRAGHVPGAVYLSVDEFKGRRSAIRGSVSRPL